MFWLQFFKLSDDVYEPDFFNSYINWKKALRVDQCIFQPYFSFYHRFFLYPLSTFFLSFNINRAFFPLFLPDFLCHMSVKTRPLQSICLQQTRGEYQRNQFWSLGRPLRPFCPCRILTYLFIFFRRLKLFFLLDTDQNRSNSTNQLSLTVD